MNKDHDSGGFCATNPISLPQIILLIIPLIVGLITKHYFGSTLLGVIPTAIIGIIIYWLVYIHSWTKQIPPDNYNYSLVPSKPSSPEAKDSAFKKESKEQVLVK